MKRYIAIVTGALLAAGCATVSMLPNSSGEIRFGESAEGKTGWSSYREEARFRDTPPSLVLEAAKAGLGDAGFALRRVDVANGVVFGEHGMTAHDWNIVAGVYFKADADDTLVAVMVEGSKDIGFSGDVTGNGWTGRILKGMRNYMADSKNQSADVAHRERRQE